MRTLLTLALALIISFAAPAMAGNPLDTLKKFSSEITFEKDVITIATHNDNRYQFDVEIAASQRQQAKGLMNRKSMAPNEGMLFIFGHSRKTAFWMKNTLIPLDMIFIDKNGRIDHIHHNAKPLDEARSQAHVLSPLCLKLMAVKLVAGALRLAIPSITITSRTSCPRKLDATLSIAH